MAIVLVSSIMIVFGYIQFDAQSSGNIFPVFSSIAISAGVLIAILTYSRERKKTEIELERERSKYFLEEIDKGFKEVYELLKNHANNKVS